MILQTAYMGSFVVIENTGYLKAIFIYYLKMQKLGKFHLLS